MCHGSSSVRWHVIVVVYCQRFGRPEIVQATVGFTEAYQVRAFTRFKVGVGGGEGSQGWVDFPIEHIQL